MSNSELVTWRTLEKEGCGFGRGNRERLSEMKEAVDDLRRRMDRLTWALVAAALTFGTAAIMLALNLLS